MSISTMKLSRITLDSLKNLEQDPQAVEKALDAYQGSIRGDRSVGDNLRRQADSVENLRRVLTSAVPKAIGELSDIGQQEAQEDWLQANPEQRELWRKGVKNGDVGAWSSPFWNIGMEKMVAAEHITRYRDSYATNYQNARTSQDPKFTNKETGEFDFMKWNEYNFSEYTKHNGMEKMRPGAFTIFGKGAGDIHATAIAKRSEAKAAQLMGEHLRTFNAATQAIINSSSTWEQKAEDIDLAFTSIANTGIDMTEYKSGARETFQNAYIEAVVNEQKDPEAILDILANTSSGGGRKFGETEHWKTFYRETVKKGDVAHNRLVDKTFDAEEKARKQRNADLPDAVMQFVRDGGTTQEWAAQNPELIQQAQVLVNSPNALDRAYGQSILAYQKNLMDTSQYQVFVSNIDYTQTRESILDAASGAGATPQMIDVLGLRLTNHAQLKTGTKGDMYVQSLKNAFLVKEDTQKRPGAMPRAVNQVYLPIRTAFHDKHIETYDNEIFRIAGLTEEDLGVDNPNDARKERNILAADAAAAYKRGMEEDIQEYISGRQEKETARLAGEGIKTIQETYMKEHKDDASLFLRGDHYTDNADILAKKIKGMEAGADGVNALLNEMNRNLLLSKRYITASNLHGIPLTLDNLELLQPKVNSLLKRIQEDVPKLSPEDKKKVQENVMESLAAFVRSLPRPVQIWMNPVGELLGKEANAAEGDVKMVLNDGTTSSRLPDAERLLIEREGTKTNDKNEHIAYKDYEDKLTGGHGHLMTPTEQAKYPEGTVIPGVVVAKWWKEDSKKAKTAAKQQAQELGIPELEDILMSVNYQLGTAWHKEKFPSAYKALKEGDYERAIFEIEHNGAGDGESLWKNQTPTRVADFKDAISKLIRG